MKILQINAVNAVASTGTIANDLNNAILGSNNDSVVAFSSGVASKNRNEYKIGNRFDTKLHGLLSRVTGKQGYFSVKATNKLLQFMDEYCPDVVVLHNLHGNFINLPLLLKYFAKHDIPTVAVLHDCWFYTGKCCHYTVEQCFKWKDKCYNCPSLKKHNISWFFDKTAQMHNDKIALFNNIPHLAVVGVSDWILNEAKSGPVFKKAKIFKRIYNWVNTDIFMPKCTVELKEKLGLVDKKVLLSVAYGWSKDKGIQTIIEMSQQLNPNEKILLVGNIQDDVVLNDNIVHISTTNSPKELAQYYSIADVFVQPSLEETFGKVTAEALSCGLPVVCFDSTTTPELVSHDCGIVLKTFDSGSMLVSARKIIELGKNEFSTACRQRAVEMFSKDKNIKEYITVFEELISLREK